jgi:peptide/nickel transport system substrate-binding protein
MWKKMFLLTVIAVGLLTIPPGGPACAAEDRDTLIIAVESDPATFDLLYAESMLEGQIGNNIYDNLLFIDDDGNIHPYLAEKYEISPDGLEYTFHLKKGVKFHNGDEMKASDVAFTMEYGKKTPYMSVVCSNINKIDVIDDYTVKLTLASTMASFLSEVAGDQFPIYSEKAVKAVETYGANPVGTGAYKFVSRKPGEEVRFEAFADHFQGAAPIKNLIYRIIPDSFSAGVALETGDVDFIWVTNASVAATLKDNKNITVRSEPTNRIQFIRMNTEKEPFKDAKLRRAVNYALNRDVIVETVYEGYGAPQDSLAIPWMAGFAEPAVRYSYDPEKAAALAKEAGVSKESPIVVELNCAGPTQRDAEVIQENLAEIGINAKINLLEPNTIWTYDDDGNFQISVGGYYMVFKDMNIMTHFYDSVNIGSGNAARYNNPKTDKLLLDGRHEVDPQKRTEIYKQFIDIVQEDAPYAAYANRYVIRAYKADLNISRTFANGIFIRDVSWK